MKHLKKILALTAFALAFVVVAGPRPAFAGSKYYVALTTVPVNASVAEFTSAYPNITGGKAIRKMVISNSSPAIAQTISLYDTCTSTTAATLKFQTYIGTTSMVSDARAILDFLPDQFRVTTPCFKKSSTSSTVDLTVFYE